MAFSSIHETTAFEIQTRDIPTLPPPPFLNKASVISDEQGWCSGESTHLRPIRPEFESWHWHHIWVEFVVGSLLCSKRFSSGYSSFPLSSKTNISKFQFDLEGTDTFQQVLLNSLVLRG